MTNFEHMKERILQIVSALDEEGLRQLASDTCMDEGEAEGIFSCVLCEKLYGDCDIIPGGNGCMKKYLHWCGKEYVPEPEWENKEDIVGKLSELLKATRIGSNIESLALSENREMVSIMYKDGSGRFVNVACDSGYGIIQDVLEALG